MNGTKSVVWLLAGIAATAAVHFAIDVKTDRAPQGIGRRVLVPGAEKATMIDVARLDESATRLVRADVWRIALPYGAKADESAVLRLSDALAFAPFVDDRTDSELLRIDRTRKDFGLDRPRVVVTVGWPEGATACVRFGAPTAAGDGVYASVGEGDAVYVVSSNVFAAANLTTADFRRRRLFELGADDVASFDVKSGAGRLLRFSRDGGMSWRLVEPRANRASSTRIREFLDALLKLEAQRFVWPTGATNETSSLSEALLAGYGFLSDSTVAITLKGAGGNDTTLSFGGDAGDGQVYALSDASVVTVPAAVREAAVAGVSAFLDTRLFPVEPKAVSAISIESEGATHLLSRDAKGEWRLDAPVSAAADAKAVEALLARILALEISNVATNGVRVSVGTNAEPVSVSRVAILADARLEDLRSKTIVKIDPKNIKRIVVTDHEAKPVAVLFDGERRAWSVESAEGSVVADGEAAERLAAALDPLNAIRIARLKVTASELGLFGLDKPLRTVAIDQASEGSIRRNVLIGDVTDGGRYATLGSSDAVFVISTECANALLAPIVK